MAVAPFGTDGLADGFLLHASDYPESAGRMEPQCFCEGGGDVVGVLTLLVGGVAQAFHDDRVVELRVQLGVQEVEEKKKTGRNR